MIDMLMRQPRNVRPLRTALYLRCYPFDPTGMECQRDALERLAQRHGLPAPFEYLDNGRRSGGRLPRLECLVRDIEQGWIDRVLIPGPFVFALDDSEAEAVTRRLRQLGCRVIELPGGKGSPTAAAVA
ncbi:hypothetical protein PUR61_29650 [Streptomyces sp. BE20]|uniref:hypothetical protein n=1 Tax=Streptomyces sp. BE20 TaxID=3002525 RepID=UPI002E78AE4F|nr:hypothetical protein [Streptomyces sp. BE20]MEE1826319.1 hypothetical protein [Streptomyces sp. BE20]